MKNFSNKQKLKEYSNAKPTLKEILKGLRQLKTKQNKTKQKKNHEELGWRKPQLESSDLKKPAYRPKHEDAGKKKKKEKNKKTSKSYGVGKEGKKIDSFSYFNDVFVPI